MYASNKFNAVTFNRVLFCIEFCPKTFLKRDRNANPNDRNCWSLSALHIDTDRKLFTFIETLELKKNKKNNFPIELFEMILFVTTTTYIAILIALNGMGEISMPRKKCAERQFAET